MALLLTSANKSDAESNQALTADVYVNVGGNFAKDAQVKFRLESDGAQGYEWTTKADYFKIEAKTGHTLYAKVIGGDTSNTSINVSVL